MGNTMKDNPSPTAIVTPPPPLEEEEVQVLNNSPEPSVDSEFTKKLRSNQMAKLAIINADNNLTA